MDDSILRLLPDVVLVAPPAIIAICLFFFLKEVFEKLFALGGKDLCTM